MPDTNCLIGPAFSLTGALYFAGKQVSFDVTFAQPADAAEVKAYEWYLNNFLVKGAGGRYFSGSIDCGKQVIGVRLLTADGWTAVKTLAFQTCRLLTGVILNGPDTLKQGDTADYHIMASYSDGVTEDVTADYSLSSTTGAVFSGNTLRAGISDTPYQDLHVTLTATKSGSDPLTKEVLLKSLTPVTLLALGIEGPDTVAEGAKAIYAVLAHYSDGRQQDVTSDYRFSCPDGRFLGPTLTVFENSIVNDTRTAVITASKGGIAQLTKTITITDTTVPGILVVDLFSDATLEVLSYIDNVEVSELPEPAYTRHNFSPATTINPADALILASDQILQDPLNWRFEFNIVKLLQDYPESTAFVWYIRGRSATAGNLNGAFVLKNRRARMIMKGGPGTYLPSVEGDDLGFSTHFTTYCDPGADHGYDLETLPVLVKFTYTVASKQLSYETTAAQEWFNTEQSRAFNRNDCQSGYTGSPVTYIVAAHTYHSTVSQADADALAQADINENGQAYANTHGSCNLVGIGIIEVNISNDTVLNAMAYIDGLGDDPELFAYTGHNFAPPVPQTSAAGATLLASDLINQSNLKWRFEFNLALLLDQYNFITTFTFYIKARSSAAGTISGNVNAFSDDSRLVMNGSTGTYLPVATGGSLIGQWPFQTHVVNGANGDYDPDALNPILKIEYHVNTKAVIVTPVTA